MYGRDILSKVDHTLLKPDATWDAIKVLCDEAVAYKAASVCIPPCYLHYPNQLHEQNLCHFWQSLEKGSLP